MNIADNVEFVATLVAGAGASKVVNDIVKNNTNVITKADKVKVIAGSAVIGSMVADKAVEHTSQKVNDAFEKIAAFRNRKNVAQ